MHFAGLTFTCLKLTSEILKHQFLKILFYKPSGSLGIQCAGRRPLPSLTLNLSRRPSDVRSKGQTGLAGSWTNPLQKLPCCWGIKKIITVQRTRSLEVLVALQALENAASKVEKTIFLVEDGHVLHLYWAQKLAYLYIFCKCHNLTYFKQRMH